MKRGEGRLEKIEETLGRVEVEKRKVAKNG